MAIGRLPGQKVTLTAAHRGNDAFTDFKLAHPEWYYQPPPNQTLAGRMFVRPYYNIRMYLRRLSDNFGLKFLVLLVSAYFGIKGFLYQLLYLAQYPYFVLLMRVDGKAYQVYGIVAQTPWSLKAFMGMISDLLPIAGYAKKWYIIICAALGVISFAILGLVDFDSGSAVVVVLLFFLGHYMTALIDLLVEGRYAELMVKSPETSSDVVSWVWMNYYMGTLLATWIVGPLSDEYDVTINTWYLKAIFLIAVPFAGQMIIPTALNYLGEKPLPVGKRGIQWAKWERFNNYFKLAIIMGLGAVGLAVVGMLNNQLWSASLAEKSVYLGQMPILVYTVFVTTVMIVSSFRLLPTGVAKAITYLFVIVASYVGIGGALDIFYLSGPNCVPDGPNFTFKYYTTLSGTAQAVAGVIGVALFQALMSEWEFRPCFWVSTILTSVAGIFDIIIVMRWNIKAGISDHVMYMLGYNIIFQVVYMFNFMPSVVLMSKLCPKGLESTLFALLAGFSNFGSSVSRSIGVYMISIFQIEMSENGPCKFDNLPWLIFVGHVVCPICIAIPLTFVLIPKSRLTDPLLKEELHDQFEDLPEPALVLTSGAEVKDEDKKTNLEM